MLKPNVFIIGAPKSGTTSLAEWLSHNPDVFLPTPKEPMYYCAFDKPFGGPDEAAINRMAVFDRNKYFQLYSAGEGHRLRVDASTDYLSAPLAPRKIYEDCADAKIVILLREPVSRMYSEHAHLIRDGLESETFEDALDLEEQRKSQQWNTLFRHRERSRYYDSVKVYFELFGEESVFVRLYDDLREDAEKLKLELCEFLGVTYSSGQEMLNLNKSGRVRNRFLDDLTRGQFLPPSVKKMIVRVVGKRNVVSFANKIQNVNLDRIPSIDPRLEEKLKEEFREDTVKLSKLINRDLNAWF